MSSYPHPPLFFFFLSLILRLSVNTQMQTECLSVLMKSIREDIEKEHHAIQKGDIIVFFKVAEFVTSFQYHKFLTSKVSYTLIPTCFLVDTLHPQTQNCCNARCMFLSVNFLLHMVIMLLMPGALNSLLSKLLIAYFCCKHLVKSCT